MGYPMEKKVKSDVVISPTITLGPGGLQFKGALVQGDSYRLFASYGSLSVNVIKEGFVVFVCHVPMSRKRAMAIEKEFETK